MKKLTKKEYLGMVVGQTTDGFGELSYLIKLDDGKTIWVAATSLTHYEVSGSLN